MGPLTQLVCEEAPSGAYVATDEQVDGQFHIGCFNHPYVDARSGGSVFPMSKKAQPYWAWRECIAAAVRAGAPVRLYGEPEPVPGTKGELGQNKQKKGAGQRAWPDLPSAQSD